jgi:membrane dipeptidase
MRPIIDAHLDLAMNIVYYDRDIRCPVDEINATERQLSDLPFRGNATLSLPELRAANVAVCFATLLSRSGPALVRQRSYRRSDLDFPVREAAWACNQAQLALYRLLEQQGEVRILKTVEELNEHWEQWESAGSVDDLPIGIVITMEGADGVLDPEQVSEWFAAGVRAIGPAHYAHSHYAAGTGVEGPLTPAGRKLLHAMRECGMVLEMTHLSDQSMEEAFDLWDGPLWASHHNCRQLVPWQRQLTDEQIRKICERGGVIGAACDAVMLDWPFADKVLRLRQQIADGQQVTEPWPLPEVTMMSIVDQMHHVRVITGSTAGIGIGTDLDGGYGNEQTPVDLKRYRDLRQLESLLEERGFSGKQIDDVFFGNWLRVLRSWLPSEPHRSSGLSRASQTKGV